jgi:hypothetical protein
MSHHKKKHGHPVPSGNQPQGGPPVEAELSRQTGAQGEAAFQDQDAKRRLGGYECAGQPPRQQPGQLNNGQQHSR